MFKLKYLSLLYDKTLRNGVLFSIFSFLNRGVSFLLLIILADYIEPKQYGELSLFNTVLMFFGYFVGLSTGGYLSVSFFKKSKECFKEDFSAICIITIVVSISSGIVLALMKDFISPFLKIPSPFLIFGAAIAMFDIFYQLNLDYFRIQEKILKYGLLSCFFGLLNMILTLYLVIVVDLNWAGFVYAQLICDASLGIFALFYFYKRRLFQLPSNLSVYKNIIFWGLPIIPHLATGWIKTGMDRYIIEGTHSMADVGYFSFAFNMMSVITMVGTAFNKTNSVNIYQTLSSNQSSDDKLRSLLKKEKCFSLMYFILVFCIDTVGSLFVWAFLPNYSASIPYFLILSIYGLFVCLYYVICNYLFYFNRTKKLMYVTFGFSLLHLLCSLVLTKYGLYYTCTLYVVFQCLICYFVFRDSRMCIKKFAN